MSNGSSMGMNEVFGQSMLLGKRGRFTEFAAIGEWMKSVTC